MSINKEQITAVILAGGKGSRQSACLVVDFSDQQNAFMNINTDKDRLLAEKHLSAFVA